MWKYYQGYGEIYCSHSCQIRARKHTKITKEKIRRALKGNKNPLGIKRSSITIWKCSIAKMGKNNPAKREEVREKISQTLKGKRNSPATEFKIGQFIGVTHPNWHGGKTKITKRLRGTGEYLKWRKMILKRDGFKCLNCSWVKDLEVHHLKKFKDFPKFRTTPINGVTLCKECHKLAEFIFPKGYQYLEKYWIKQI